MHETTSARKSIKGTSLVVQWVKIHFSMRGAGGHKFNPRPGELRSYMPRATKPVPQLESACVLEPSPREAHDATQTPSATLGPDAPK